MSKSILVLDTTESCEKCQLCSLGNYGTKRCTASDRSIFLKDKEHKPDWCPLIEAPKKKTNICSCRNGVLGLNQLSERRFADGYNSCIDEILKECGENEVD